MKHLYCAALALVLAASAVPALSQERDVGPGRFAVNPSISLSAPATNPIQSQVEDDYATQLSVEQRQMLQLNPSGLTRPEIAVGHALNGFAPR